MERGLLLAGWGLQEGQATREAIEAIRSAVRVYVETYTVSGSAWIVESLTRLLGPGKVIAAARDTIEENSHEILLEAARAPIAVVAPGDPLIATTHRSLLVEAARQGIPYRVLPGISGVCAAKTLSWLDYYKFGRTATIPGPWRRIRPYSVYQYLMGNLCAGLHTLLLLDIDPSSGEQLDPCTATRVLLQVAAEVEAETGSPLRLEDLPALVVVRAGMRGHKTILLPSLRDACREEARNLYDSPSSIVVPGAAAEYEWEAVEALAWKPLGSQRSLKISWREQPSLCNYYGRLLEIL